MIVRTVLEHENDHMLNGKTVGAAHVSILPALAYLFSFLASFGVVIHPSFKYDFLPC
jgi:hypothetical protein